jgi:hypothetical protein
MYFPLKERPKYCALENKEKNDIEPNVCWW